MLELIEASIPWIVRLADAGSVLVILFGIVRALLSVGANIIKGPIRLVPDDCIRFDLGRTLALGLELLLAADILETATSPSEGHLIQLAVIAVIRTGLNFFLGREMQAEAGRQVRHV